MKHNRLIEEGDLGLVFSGGGARGAYQIGAWQALKEFGITDRIKVVTGSSVGAINGAAFVQDDFETVKDLWDNLELGKIFKSVSKGSNLYYSLMKEYIRNRGVDVSPLKEILRTYLVEDKIRKSSVKFAISAYNLTEYKNVYMEKDDIPEGLICEYIIASATFPIFKPHVVEDKKYLDGGIYDSVPLELCHECAGVEQIISLDLTEIPSFHPTYIYNHYQNKNKRNILEIKSKKSLGSVMNFTKENSRRLMDLGYEDAYAILNVVAV